MMMALNPRQTRMLNRAAPVLRWLVALALMIVLARVVADTALLWLAGPVAAPEPDASMPRLDTAGPAGERARLDTARVSDWELFGEFEPEDPEQVEVVDAPDTTLQLELLGLFQHGDPERARAIIAETGGDAELYHPGDDLPGGAVLEQIHVDRVILRHRGELEALRFEEPELGIGAVSGAESRQDGPRGPPGRPGSAENGEAVAEGLSGDLREQRDTIIRELSLQPVEQGQGSGYRITDQAPREVISRVGLRPGDRVISINGHELGDEDSDLAALREVMESGSGTIEVQRGSRTFTVSYPP